MASDQLEKWQAKFDSLFPNGLVICLGDPTTAPLHPAARAEVVAMEGLVPKVSVQAFFADKEFLFDVITFEAVQKEPVALYRITTSDDQNVTLSDGVNPALAAEMKGGRG